MANQIELKIEAEQYLTQMKAKYQRETRAWEQFAKEIPEKLVQLIKSGFSTNISRANNYNSGGGRTIGINISFDANMDGAKSYLESLKKDIPRKGEVFHKTIEEFDKKLQSYFDGGLDSELFEKLVKHFAQWVEYAKNLRVAIKDKYIEVEMPAKYLERKKHWTELANRQELESCAARYGIAITEVPTHKKYLEAKQKAESAYTSAEITRAVKLLRDLNGYRDTNTLISQANQSAEKIRQREAEEERQRKEAEEKRKAEEARKKAEEERKRQEEMLQKKKQASNKLAFRMQKIKEELANQEKYTQKENQKTQKQIQTAQEERETLGFFKFSEKKQLSREIEMLQQGIEKRNTELARLADRTTRRLSQMEQVKELMEAKPKDEVVLGTQFHSESGQSMQWLVVRNEDNRLTLLAKHTVSQKRPFDFSEWRNMFRRKVLPEVFQQAMCICGNDYVDIPYEADVLAACHTLKATPEQALTDFASRNSYITTHASHYWIADRGLSQYSTVAYVDPNGHIGMSDNGRYYPYGVRPKICLKLDELIDKI